MNASVSLRLFQLTKEFIPDEAKAREFVSKIEETIEDKFNATTTTLATSENLKDLEMKLEKRFTDVNKNIFIVGLVQFLAIVGSVLAIVNFMLK